MSDGDKLAGLNRNPWRGRGGEGRAFGAQAGQSIRFLSNTQFNSETVSLVPERFSVCNSVIYRWICSGELQVCKQQLL